MVRGNTDLGTFVPGPPRATMYRPRSASDFMTGRLYFQVLYGEELVPEYVVFVAQIGEIWVSDEISF
jgi:hypothetical protein